MATLAASYSEISNVARALLGAHFGPAGMARIFEANAAAFYYVSGAHRQQIRADVGLTYSISGLGFATTPPS